MLDLLPLLGSAESPGARRFVVSLHKLTRMHSLLTQLPTEYFLFFCSFFFFPPRFFKFSLCFPTGELVFLVFEN